MKTKLLMILCLLSVLFQKSINAQSTYTSSDYAAIGDNFYLTTANNFAIDYVTTGANFTWDFSSLTGTSQDQLLHRNPTATGYSVFLFPYIYFPNNTNLSSTDATSSSFTAAGQTIGVQDSNDYFKKSTTELKQVASAYKFNYNGTLIPITNQYSTPDKIYTFPINYNDTETNNSEYTINIPGVYYQNKTLSRTNLVDGWGNVTTPLGNFPNALRMMTTLVENDTISIAGTGVPRIIRTTRELKWFDTSKKYPILIVTQSFVASVWTTTNIQYMDNLQDFQSTALFAYTPLAPTAGATVYFQNLSTNATTYSWEFGDPSSGVLNMSSDQNPTHIYNSNGTYPVTLTASNGTFSDAITLPVVVSDVLATDENTNFKKLMISPNPFSNFIKISNEISNSEFELINMEGKTLYKGNFIYNEDFSTLSSGIYILKVKNNSDVSTFKLVKK